MLSRLMCPRSSSYTVRSSPPPTTSRKDNHRGSRSSCGRGGSGGGGGCRSRSVGGGGDHSNGTLSPEVTVSGSGSSRRFRSTRSGGGPHIVMKRDSEGGWADGTIKIGRNHINTQTRLPLSPLPLNSSPHCSQSRNLFSLHCLSPLLSPFVIKSMIDLKSGARGGGSTSLDRSISARRTQGASTSNI